MAFRTQVFAYCERGLDPAFWAEPLNAVSNLAFLIAAALGAAVLMRLPAGQRGGLEISCVALAAGIGIGSFLFHTLATRWAALADTIPIGIFMLLYLVLASRRFLGLSAAGVAGVVVAFIAALVLAGQPVCAGRPCLNGSAGYLPALAALAAIGLLLRARAHPAAWALLVGCCVLALSLALRTIDRAACPYTILAAARPTGTHFLWHLLNGVLIHILLQAAIADRARRPVAR